jgi:hypothetical protein
MERMADKEEGEHEVSPEVAAARAEEQTLAEEDLGEEAIADDDDEADDGESETEAEAETEESGDGKDAADDGDGDGGGGGEKPN